MPATPFPHPSVHTTTSVHSLTCSSIRSHSLTHSQRCWLSPIAMATQPQINLQTSLFFFPEFCSSIYINQALSAIENCAFQKCCAKEINVKIPGLLLQHEQCFSDSKLVIYDGHMMCILPFCSTCFFLKTDEMSLGRNGEKVQVQAPETRTRSELGV